MNPNYYTIKTQIRNLKEEFKDLLHNPETTTEQFEEWQKKMECAQNEQYELLKKIHKNTCKSVT